MIALGILLSGCGSSSSPTIIGKWSEVYDSSGNSTAGTAYYYKTGLLTQSNGLKGAWAILGPHTIQFTVRSVIVKETYTVAGNNLTLRFSNGTVQKYIRLS